MARELVPWSILLKSGSGWDREKVGADAVLNKEVFSFLKSVFSAISLLSLRAEREGLTAPA